MADFINQEFSIPYSFPVVFTRDMFRAANLSLLQAVTRVEPHKRHRLLFVIDENVLFSHPGLPTAIDKYVQVHSQRMESVGEPVVVAGGEAAKNDFQQVLGLLEEINTRGIDRQSFIVVVGGGAVLDMVCFAGAIAHRGIRTIRIPTTVLSQNDSGVGVKNGINWFGKKNFLGTFVPPFAVINDIAFIESLEHRDKVAGMAEAVKVALIRDAAFYEYLEGNAAELAATLPDAMAYQIRRTAELHLKHIATSGDPFEFGSARPLDFGHWSAHKLESITQHRLRHGEAVAIGIAVDSVYSAKAGFLRSDRVDRILALLERLGFVLWDDALLERDNTGQYRILGGLNEFREHLGGELTITLLRDIGNGFEVHEMNHQWVLESIQLLRHRCAITVR